MTGCPQACVGGAGSEEHELTPDPKSLSLQVEDFSSREFGLQQISEVT